MRTNSNSRKKTSRFFRLRGTFFSQTRDSSDSSNSPAGPSLRAVPSPVGLSDVQTTSSSPPAGGLPATEVVYIRSSTNSPSQHTLSGHDGRPPEGGLWITNSPLLSWANSKYSRYLNSAVDSLSISFWFPMASFWFPFDLLRSPSKFLLISFDLLLISLRLPFDFL